jgi:hypothetical protein
MKQRDAANGHKKKQEGKYRYAPDQAFKKHHILLRLLILG